MSDPNFKEKSENIINLLSAEFYPSMVSVNFPTSFFRFTIFIFDNFKAGIKCENTAYFDHKNEQIYNNYYIDISPVHFSPFTYDYSAFSHKMAQVLMLMLLLFFVFLML